MIGMGVRCTFNKLDDEDYAADIMEMFIVLSGKVWFVGRLG